MNLSLAAGLIFFCLGLMLLGCKLLGICGGFSTKMVNVVCMCFVHEGGGVGDRIEQLRKRRVVGMDGITAVRVKWRVLPDS